MKPNLRRSAALSTFVVAVALASCAPGAMDMMGEMMMDAGGRLVDAGSQLSDRALPDAQAQDSCATNCTMSGVLRVMTADTDPAQLVRGSVRSTPLAPPTDTGIRGPFVVTAFETFSNNGGHSLSVSATGSCADAASLELLTDEGIRSLSASQAGQGFENGISERAYVRPGETLCVSCAGTSGEACTWSGFRPYE